MKRSLETHARDPIADQQPTSPVPSDERGTARVLTLDEEDLHIRSAVLALDMSLLESQRRQSRECG
jgi:hypothetical protein